MTALPGYHNVIPMHPAEAAFTARKITPANFSMKNTEAPMAVDVPTEAPHWQWRDKNGRIIPFQPLKPQAEIDDEAPVFSPVAYVVMFSAVVVVVAIITAFDFLMGVI